MRGSNFSLSFFPVSLVCFRSFHPERLSFWRPIHLISFFLVIALLSPALSAGSFSFLPMMMWQSSPKALLLCPLPSGKSSPAIPQGPWFLKPNAACLYL